MKNENDLFDKKTIESQSKKKTIYSFCVCLTLSVDWGSELEKHIKRSGSNGSKKLNRTRMDLADQMV